MRISRRSYAPDPKEIRAALDRIAASRQFETSPKLTSFLRFVVEATLAGRGDRIKGYTIGVEALGRDESFDPQTDPIVRVEAIRLRRALACYYAGAGAHDPFVIDMPRGRYVPRFSRVRRSAPVALWLWARSALQRLLAAEGARLLPRPRFTPQRSDVREDQQAQAATAARARRSRAGRDRRHAPHAGDDPRGL